MEGSASTSGTVACVALVRKREEGQGADVDCVVESIVFSVDLVNPQPKLKGHPASWFTRVVPQAWQHQRTKGQDQPRQAGGCRGRKWHHYRADGASGTTTSGGDGESDSETVDGGALRAMLARWLDVCEEMSGPGRAPLSATQRWRLSIKRLSEEGLQQGVLDTQYVEDGFLLLKLPPAQLLHVPLAPQTADDGTGAGGSAGGEPDKAAVSAG